MVSADNNAVAAILVTNGRNKNLSKAVNSVLNQTLLPEFFFLVDVSDPKKNEDVEFVNKISEGVHGAIQSLSLPIEFIRVKLNDNTIQAQQKNAKQKKPSRWNFSNSINFLINSGEIPNWVNWIWLLHDDTEADDKTLFAEITEGATSDNIGVVGAKQIDPHTNQLINVGYTISKTGRRIVNVGYAEIDQRQYDSIEDIFAVSMNGALVNIDCFSELGGLSSELDGFDSSLEFCRRIHLNSKRVVVASDASMRHEMKSYLGKVKNDVLDTPERLQEGFVQNIYGVYRSRTIYRLATINLLLVIPVWIGLFFGAFISTIIQAYSERSAALRVLGGTLSGLFSFKSIAHIRSLAHKRIINSRLNIGNLDKKNKGNKVKVKNSKSVHLKRSSLNALIAGPAQVQSIEKDFKMELSAKIWEPFSPSLLQTQNLKIVKQKRYLALALTVALLVILTIAELSSNIMQFVANPSGMFIAEDLTTSSAGRLGVWQAVISNWSNYNFGVAAPANGWLLIIAIITLLTGSVKLTISLVIVFSLILAGLSMWVAAGAFTRNNSARVCASVFWAVIPSFSLSLQKGDLGNLLGAIFLPLFIYFALSSVQKTRTDFDLGRPTFRNYFIATGLFGALYTLCSSTLILPVLLFFVVAGFFSRRFWFGIFPVIVFNFYQIIFILTNLKYKSWSLLISDLTPLRSLGYFILLAIVLVFLQQRVEFIKSHIVNYVIYAVVLVVVGVTGVIYCNVLGDRVEKEANSDSWLSVSASTGEEVGKLRVESDYLVPAVAEKIVNQSGNPHILYINAGEPNNQNGINYAILNSRSTDIVNDSVYARLLTATKGISESDAKLRDILKQIMANPDIKVTDELEELGIGGIYVAKGAVQTQTHVKIIEQIDTLSNSTRIIEGSESAFWRIGDSNSNSADQEIIWDNSNFHNAIYSPFTFVYSIILILILLVYIYLSLPIGTKKVIRYEV
ncbi:MAG: hypothetical protein LBM13_01675 [Candidatus Ancillula sp.]|jgi:GT2 family glycosyltransferase|nr:hypothetical protein [Candidatus Ancillula sp.]